MTKIEARARQSAHELGNVLSHLAALDTMNVGELSDKYRALYGEPTRSRNKDYLRKRLAWRIQELAEGGLPESALERIRALGDQIPERWRIRQGPTETREAPRDPRVPPVGTVLRRIFEGKMHEVTVCVEGFEYAGQRYKTLSAIARAITGTRWNGLLFFKLNKRCKPIVAKPEELP
ncbi:MAG: DUF2924 domain-containing protein [Polyangiaceae bacterium]|nr:DUF2924 domain-containing protein [Polyangiaceae bacterium]